MTPSPALAPFPAILLTFLAAILREAKDPLTFLVVILSEAKDPLFDRESPDAPVSSPLRYAVPPLPTDAAA